ncbi:MAG: hypothetical protein CV087_20765 [Candidatus Brocadia sp. WS118]|nr:MAG: hypothetical protein CV087_20765 [Candidatus Brocadia sp. WS118]
MSNNIKKSRNKCLKNLYAMKLKLLRIDADELSQDKKNKLAKKLDTCSRNILTLETADLKNLSSDFIDKVPELLHITEELKNDLNNLNNAIEIIRVAAGGLDTVAGIVKLIAKA